MPVVRELMWFFWLRVFGENQLMARGKIQAVFCGIKASPSIKMTEFEAGVNNRRQGKACPPLCEGLQRGVRGMWTQICSDVPTPATGLGGEAAFERGRLAVSRRVAILGMRLRCRFPAGDMLP